MQTLNIWMPNDSSLFAIVSNWPMWTTEKFGASNNNIPESAAIATKKWLKSERNHEHSFGLPHPRIHESNALIHRVPRVKNIHNNNIKCKHIIYTFDSAYNRLRPSVSLASHCTLLLLLNSAHTFAQWLCILTARYYLWCLSQYHPKLMWRIICN